MKKIDIFRNSPFYFVTNEGLSLNRSDVEVVKEVVKAGVQVVQLRDKKTDEKGLEIKAKAIKKIIDDYAAQPTLFIVNDHVDLALAVGADGVHLGQTDTPLKQAVKLKERLSQSEEGLLKEDFLKEDFLLGISTHNLDEALIAQADGADYINIGPIYPTTTKKNSYPPLASSQDGSLDKLKEIIRAIKIPFSVMGGIKISHFAPLLKAGAKTLAMISEISQREDIGGYIAKLNEEYEKWGEKNLFLTSA